VAFIFFNVLVLNIPEKLLAGRKGDGHMKSTLIKIVQIENKICDEESRKHE
jgi:hypothetical protein